MQSLTNKSKLERYFTIVKAILFCMPFLCLGYLSLGAGGDKQGILTASPTAAVSFLSAMVQPYPAWLIHLRARKRLADGRNLLCGLNLTALIYRWKLMMMSTAGLFHWGLWGWCLWKDLPPPAQHQRLLHGNRAKIPHLFAGIGAACLSCLIAGLWPVCRTLRFAAYNKLKSLYSHSHLYRIFIQEEYLSCQQKYA